MTPEGKVKAGIKKILKDMGAYYSMPVMTGYGNSGTPDFLCCYKGVFFGIEAKANNGKLTALQQKAHEDIRNAGGFVFVVYPNDLEYLAENIVEYCLDVIFSTQFKEIRPS